ncbi:MAG: NAD(P)-dependent dehydrogenase (short-subunit alcohol dehydrogenase family) [Polyangiales bacterium]|jgi:NAD(P)-dependent dehydrogenase (short-subunit alcohol dehydrogenase family)
MTTEIKTLHLDAVIANHTQDLTGKIAAITGTTSGTGFVCARELAKLGATVLLLNRDSDRSNRSFAKLREEVPAGTFTQVSCDLQHFAAVRKAAQFINMKHGKLDILCNNAGVMALADEATKDGYDVQMQTNCLSHFLLTKKLFPLLRKSDDGRVVQHTSMARLGAPLAEEYFAKNGGKLGGDGTEEEAASFSGPRWERYHQTKLANCAFAFGLKQLLDVHKITNVKSLLAHPGFALTSLQSTSAKSGGMDANSPFMAKAQSAEDGALGIIRACADPAAVSGNFYGPEQWAGFPNLLPPEESLFDPKNVQINWDGCQVAVGKFTLPGLGGREGPFPARTT